MAAGGGEEPNLTPFIDLFSVLICFLLMTAAWLQLESLQTNIDSTTAKDSPPDQPEPPPPDDKKKAKLSVLLAKNETVMRENEIETKVAKSAGNLDRSRVESVLNAWKKKYPDKKDVVVNSEAGVQYGELIGIYDLLVSSGWPDVGISPN